MEESVRFLKEISGTVDVIFHADCDGCCSGAIMLAFLKQKDVKAVPVAVDLEEEFFSSLGNADYTVILDLAIDHYKEWISHLKKGHVLVIDHHVIRNNLNKLGFIHVNPRFGDPNLYTSASMVTHDVCRKAGLNVLEWVGKVGAVGDRALKGDEKEKTAAYMVDAVKAIRKEKGLVSLAKHLSRCESIDEFLKEDKYVNLKETLESELEKQIALFDITSSGEIVFFEVKSRYSITAILSSMLSDMYPKKTIMIFTKKGDIYKVSGRSQKYNLAEAFEKASNGIGKGGGHPAAAGATVNDVFAFKARLEKLLKK